MSENGWVVLVFEKKGINRIKKEKERLERALEVDIIIKNEEVVVEGDEKDCWEAKKIIYAVGKGFDFNTAMLLKGDDFVLESIDVEEFAKNPESKKRILARVIGRKGSIKRKIEELTDTFLCIGNKTIDIIGEYEDSMNAKEAVLKILNGSLHATALRFLERKRRDKKIKSMI